MRPRLSLRRPIAAMALAAGLALPAMAAETSVNGTFALPGAAEKASGTVTVRETGPLTRELVIGFADKATGKAITRFDEELTKKLHLLGTDAQFSTFIHEHAAKPESDGRLRVSVRFPKPGLYRLYADASPTGLGQQVVRFDVPVGSVPEVPAASTSDGGAATSETMPLEARDGRYSVRLASPALRAGSEGMIELSILKDGKPATDLKPYLGVAAHAVLIAKSDLSYVHTHASGAEDAGAHSGGHGMHHSKARPDGNASKLLLHVTPPRAGAYALWIQFEAGGEVRTVPFTLSVSPA